MKCYKIEFKEFRYGIKYVHVLAEHLGGAFEKAVKLVEIMEREVIAITEECEITEVKK